MSKGVIFNIQRYSIHDGPGIRTTVFLKGCPLSCFWCQNPESQTKKPEIFLDKSKCILCGRCVAICPTGATRLLEESSAIDRGICTGCGKCAEVCPNEARKVTGKFMTVDEVVSEVLRDTKFYENSGGGVTLSGGDPLAQPDFALSIMQRCKDEGLHVTLDTCGYAPWPTMEKLLKYADLVLFDIKIMDATKHREATRKDNHVILMNARRIARLKPMRIRIPVIPGFNDSLEEVRKIAHFTKNELGLVEIDLLPYNKMGEVKYEYLDRSYIPLEAKDDSHMQALESVVSLEVGLSH